MAKVDKRVKQFSTHDFQVTQLLLHFSMFFLNLSNCFLVLKRASKFGYQFILYCEIFTKKLFLLVIPHLESTIFWLVQIIIIYLWMLSRLNGQPFFSKTNFKVKYLPIRWVNDRRWNLPAASRNFHAARWGASLRCVTSSCMTQILASQQSFDSVRSSARLLSPGQEMRLILDH